ncbi:MAG: hypothetical protein M3Q65_21730 [Chloroflexota bacterium]|nr:hypothetical protein [Chloroflexota bacterium]
MSVTDALHALCAELAADGVPHPLGQSFTLAALWHDLATIAGEDLPAAVVALVEASVGTVGTEDAA